MQGWGQDICISNKYIDDAADAGGVWGGGDNKEEHSRQR